MPAGRHVRKCVGCGRNRKLRRTDGKLRKGQDDDMNEESKEVRKGNRECGEETASKPVAENGRTFRSAEMFANAREVIIEHEGEHYRLRSTRNGKLILTK